MGFTQHKIWATVVAVTGLFSFLYFSSPRGLVVDATGNIDGILNGVRASVQGKKFWNEQLEEARILLYLTREIPAQLITSEQELQDALAHVERDWAETTPKDLEAEQPVSGLREERLHKRQVPHAHDAFEANFRKQWAEWRTEEKARDEEAEEKYEAWKHDLLSSLPARISELEQIIALLEPRAL